MRNIVTYINGKMVIAMDITMDIDCKGKQSTALAVYTEGQEPWVYHNYQTKDFPCVKAFVQWYTTEPSAEDRKNSEELRDFVLYQDGIYR